MNGALRKFERDAVIFLVRHLIYGAAGGFLFGGLILYFDVAGLRSLALASEDRWLVLGMLFFGLFVTFGSLGMAVGIMSLGRDDN